MLELHETGQERQIEQLGTVDLVVAIPSYNNAETIGAVVQAARESLLQHFGSYKSVIIHSDGGSKDGTPERVLELAGENPALLQIPYPVYPGHKLSPFPYEIPGRGSALQTVLAAARSLNAKGCALIEPTLPTITPEGVKWLLHPIVEQGFDLVSPRYSRPKFQGTLISSMLYPMTRALYAKRLWQPMGGDFGFSARLMDYYRSQDIWQSDSGFPAVEVRLTTEAICGSFKLCQAFLGAKSNPPKDPPPDLEEAVVFTAGSVFAEMEKTVAFWQKVRASEAVPTFGVPSEAPPETGAINVKRMIETFRLGYQNLQEIWSQVLSPAALLELKKLAFGGEETFRFGDAIWVRVVYDFALGYHLRVMNRDHLLRALTPLYLGWLASFVLEMQDAGPREMDTRVERLCLTYEGQKPYLISRWRWPDRFNP